MSRHEYFHSKSKKFKTFCHAYRFSMWYIVKISLVPFFTPPLSFGVDSFTELSNELCSSIENFELDSDSESKCASRAVGKMSSLLSECTVEQKSTANPAPEGEFSGFHYKIGEQIPSVSDQQKKPMLIVLLHGSGADETDLLPVGSDLARILKKTGVDRGVTTVGLRGPISNPLGPGFKWFDGFSPWPGPTACTQDIPQAATKLRWFFERAPAYFGTSPQHSFLVGFSQGATVAWSVALSGWAQDMEVCQPRFVIMSGRLMPEHGDKESILGKQTRPATVSRKVEVLATHGEHDDVTPISMANESNQIATTLLGEHAIIKYKRYQAGHTITSAMLNDAANFMALSESLTEVEYPMANPSKN
jgi:phospholipase/carboxylesterase